VNFYMEKQAIKRIDNETELKELLREVASLKASEAIILKLSWYAPFKDIQELASANSISDVELRSLGMEAFKVSIKDNRRIKNSDVIAGYFKFTDQEMNSMVVDGPLQYYIAQEHNSSVTMMVSKYSVTAQQERSAALSAFEYCLVNSYEAGNRIKVKYQFDDAEIKLTAINAVIARLNKGGSVLDLVARFKLDPEVIASARNLEDLLDILRKFG
jgi:hypothetical protein